MIMQQETGSERGTSDKLTKESKETRRLVGLVTGFESDVEPLVIPGRKAKRAQVTGAASFYMRVQR